ncbi:MAG TPA: ABC transporter ATP-binding protein [Gemmatimonadaceae bacterium]|nr:ABC transporter ATP-binding protein [Gemmatimonadaceae bacterium]
MPTPAAQSVTAEMLATAPPGGEAPRSQAASFAAVLALGLRAMWRRPLRATLFLSTTLLQGAVQGLLIWTLREVLVRLSHPGAGGRTVLLVGALAFFAVWLLRSITAFLADQGSLFLAHRVEIDSMTEVLGQLLRMSVRYFDTTASGDLVMACYQDLRGVRTATLEVGRVVLYVSQLVGLAVAAWLMSPKLTLIGLVLVPLGAVPAHWFGRRITAAAQRERHSVATLQDSFIQVSAGIRAIKVNQAEERILAQARRTGQRLYGELIQQVRHQGYARLLLESVSGLGLVLILTVGGRDVARGTIEWQALLGLLVAIMAVYAPVMGLLTIYTGVRRVIPNLDRVEQLLHATPEMADRSGALALRAAPEQIELRNVGFVYDGAPALAGLSAVFRRGETIGIVGPSGAGKSTLLSLLLRFYDPTAGAILFDGVDLRDLRHADLMALSGIVLQEPFLLADTVADNIRFGHPDAPMEAVVAAAQAANVHDEIMQMEEGYATLIGNGGNARGLSGGQRQRISIAAAILKNAPLLFLDEATSSLDSLSEQRVQAAVDRLMRGRTTFIVAHRMSTLRDVDRILVLDQGRMVGLDTHERLLATCPIYRRLWSHQTLQERPGSERPRPVRIAES